MPHLFVRGEGLLFASGTSDSPTYLIQSALIIAGSIFPWCVAMGATFPLMMAHLKEERTGFSFLYQANVLGAVAGTIVTVYFLVELLGLQRTLHLGSALNILIALLAVASARCAGPAPAAVAAVAPSVADGLSPTVCRTLLFTTGLSSMGMEVVWARLFTPVLSTFVYAFAQLLFAYLVATAAGSWLYRRHLRRGRPISSGTLLAGLAAASFLPILLNDPRYNLNYRVALTSIMLFCGFLGYLTPLLVDAVGQGEPARAGRAYALNVVGSILGPLTASYLLLPTVGAKVSLILFALPFLAFFAAQARRTPAGVRLSAGILACGFLASALFINVSYEERLSPLFADGVIRRDHVATVVTCGQGREKTLFVNGIKMTFLTPITKCMAHFPAACLVEKPREALVICFGMGTTYRSFLTWEGMNVSAVELVPSVKAAFGDFFDDTGMILAQPNGRIVVDDGRRFLKRVEARYNIITVDPPPPVESSGSSLLYSMEFYALVRRRLAPGGVFLQWFPGGEARITASVARSLAESFPHVRTFRSMHGWGYHFLASENPVLLGNAADLAARLPKAAARDLLEWSPGETAEGIFSKMLASELPIAALTATEPEARITDDRPYNEFFFIRRETLPWATN